MCIRDSFAPAQALSLGLNTITVNSVSFDRTVKFQFSNGAVEFSTITLNGDSIYQGVAKKLAGFGGVENSWGSGKNVRFGIKIVATTRSLQGFLLNNLELHHIFPSPTATQNIHKGYGIKIETQSDTTSLLLNTISNIIIENCDLSFTGHYGIWIKSIGLNNIDSVKNSDVLIKNCNFIN